MRRFLVVLFFITGCNDNEDMQFTQHGVIASKVGYDIELIWVIGDSHATKRNPTGSAYGPTPTAGTVYQWDTSGSVLYEIGATDILQSGAPADAGSFYPQYGISRYTDTGVPVVFVTSGIGGSNYSPRTGDTGDWTDADTLWSTAKTNYDNCKAYLLARGYKINYKVKVVLGVNDGRGATPLATVESDITDFYDRFESDYPGIEIGIVLPGRDENSVNTTRGGYIRTFLINEAKARSNVYVACSEVPYWANGYYDSDNLHLIQTGNNVLGEMMARWDRNTGVSNKWARAIVSCHFDDLSISRKNLIQNFITNVGSDFWDLEYLYVFKTTIDDNIVFSWRFITSGVNNGSAVFSANDNLATNGSSTYYLTGHIASDNNLVATSTDYFDGIKIKVNNSAAGGSTRVALGVNNAASTSQSLIGQLSTSLIYARSNDLNALTDVETKLWNN
jgi:hypothetical protein